MEEKMSTVPRKYPGGRRFIIVVVFIFLICGLAAAGYVNDYYLAGDSALAALQSDELVTVTVQENKTVVFAPNMPLTGAAANIDAGDFSAPRGLIFYPGGKVEYTAYAPLLRKLAERGWHCVLVKMPANLAVLDMNAADGIADQFPEVESWYMGGHSLGGAMAASYVAKHEDAFDGLILLASYSTEDLATAGLNVYSLYGSEDMVLNHEKYEEYYSNLPADVHELVIEGGCHAGFGDYGAQDGDGVPAITADEQIEITANLLALEY